MRRVFLLLVIALVSSCKRTDRAAPDLGPSKSADASAVASASAASPPPAPSGPRFELVALRIDPPSESPELRLDDLGTHVVLTSKLPVAWAEGDGPLVREAKLGQGFTSREDPPEICRVQTLAGSLPDGVFAIYGSLPVARGVKYDLSLHQWSAGGWRRATPPLAQDTLPSVLAPFGEKSVVLVSYGTTGNAVPDAADPLVPRYEVMESGSPARKRLVFREGVGDGEVVGTRDGHLFRFGPKTLGMHLVHRREDGTSTVHVFPGTEKCNTRKMYDEGSLPRGLHVSTEGGHAFLQIAYAPTTCATMQTGAFEERPTGLARFTAIPPKLDPKFPPDVVGVSPDGTPWLRDGSTLYHGDATYKMLALRSTTKPDAFELASPKGATEKEQDRERCSPSQVFAKSKTGGGEDVWVTASCSVDKRHVDVVLRYAKPQPPIVLEVHEAHGK
jgi:hypothetical protein